MTGRYLKKVRNIAVVAIILVFACRAANAVGTFDGDWSYQSFDEEGGLHDEAAVHLRQTGSAVQGTWEDGTSQRSWSGELKGIVRGGKLYALRCSDPYSFTIGNDCPNYGNYESMFFLRDGKLVWLRKYKKGYKEYATLNQGGLPIYQIFRSKKLH